MITENLQNIFTIIAGGAVLIAVLFVLRFVLKLTWKVIRVALILLSLLLVAGVFLGYIDIVIK